jgi:hypothetical protein
VYKFDDTHVYIFAIGGHYDSLEPSGVGTPVTRSPRHRPGRAVFSHLMWRAT